MEKFSFHVVGKFCFDKAATILWARQSHKFMVLPNRAELEWEIAGDCKVAKNTTTRLLGSGWFYFVTQRLIEFTDVRH